MARNRPVRRTLSTALLLALLSSSPIGAPTGTTLAGTSGCGDGWGVTSDLISAGIQDVLALGPDRALAVGGTGGGWHGRDPAWLTWDGSAWSAGSEAAVKGDEVLQSVAGDEVMGVWAAGFAAPGPRSGGLVRRWTPEGWVVDGPPRPATGGETLVAVDTDPTGGVWAVGMHASPASERTGLVWRRTVAGTWTRAGGNLPIGTSLTGVLANAPDDVWIVGSRATSSGLRPLLRHWNGSAWKATTLPDLGLEAVLMTVAGTQDGTLWAVGWQVVDGDPRPLVLQRDGRTWSVAEAPALGGRFGMLFDVTLDDEGRPFVGGMSYRDAVGGYVSVVARRDEDGWDAWPTPAGASLWVAALSGDPSSTGWIATRDASGARLRRVCVDGPKPDHAVRRAPGSAAGRAGGGGRRTIDERLPRPRPGLRVVPRLPRGGTLPDLVAVDLAPGVGLTGTVMTHGADIADLDGDGRRDLFISQHGGLPGMWLRRGDGYQRQLLTDWERRDRHDCTIASLGGGPLPDVFCSVGADGGMGYKTNELWLDPGDGTVQDVAPERGLADPLGRGREVAVFDADGDGDLDVFLGNSGMRYDGQASPNRLLRNDGTGRFRWDPASGLGSDRGAQCQQVIDFDVDGDPDLLLCVANGAVVTNAGLALYRNDGGRFSDVSASLHAPSIGEVDAAMGQLGGGPRPDLVQLSQNRIRIALFSGGRFRTVYERAVVGGQALALGDADGDGALDIYLQAGNPGNQPDLLLRNDGTGRGWTPLEVPSTTEESAEDVMAFDHDGDGRDDFLVLNGWAKAGPMQLISFQPVPGGAGH